jgi:hypothetical protein
MLNFWLLVLMTNVIYATREDPT